MRKFFKKTVKTKEEDQMPKAERFLNGGFVIDALMSKRSDTGTPPFVRMRSAEPVDGHHLIATLNKQDPSEFSSFWCVISDGVETCESANLNDAQTLIVLDALSSLLDGIAERDEALSDLSEEFKNLAYQHKLRAAPEILVEDDPDSDFSEGP